MAFQSVPNGVGAEIRYTWDGVDCETTLGFYRSTPASQSLMDALAAQLELWFTVEVLPYLSSTVIYRETYTRDLEANPFLQGLSNQETGSGGGQASPSEPNAITKSIIFKTQYAGRSARGANRLPGLVESIVTNRVVQQAWMDTMIQAYEDLNTYSLQANCRHSVVSRVTGGNPRPTGVLYFVTGYSFPNARVGTTRSRMV